MTLLLQPEAVPVNASCAALAETLRADGLHWALTGGEDYQLVGTMAAERAEEICEQYKAQTGKLLTIIGRVESGEAGSVCLLQDGQRSLIEQRGYDHFGAEESKPNDLSEQIELAESDTVHLQRLIQQQLKELAEQEEQHRIYRHDLNNHLACLAGLLQCGETTQAMAYLQQMIAELPKKTQREYSSRTVLNILLQQKAQQAQQYGLDVQFSVEDGLLDFIGDYDLCTLLGNLLDNGIEHSHGDSDCWLYLDIISGKKNDVLIRMDNSCAQAPKVQNGNLATQKEQPELHGKGITQIQRITARYGGQFSWLYDEPQKKFVTQCRFIKAE